MGAALRSCYPEFVAKKKSVALVDEVFLVESMEGELEAESDFRDVTDLLERTQSGPNI